MKKLVAMFLAIAMVCISSCAIADIPNSDKDPDGKWKDFISLMMCETVLLNDEIPEEMYYDCFCYFVWLYMKEVYGDKLTIGENEWQVNQVYLMVAIDNAAECKANNDYSLMYLSSVCRGMSGYDSYTNILDWIQ